MSPKTKRRTQKEREENINTIFRWFRKEKSIPSEYEAVKKKEFRNISETSLKRDLHELEKYGCLESKRGSRRARSYSLTFKGLLVGLKTGVFSPEEMRQVRLRNNIEFPSIVYPIPSASSISEIKRLAETMEEFKPRLFYEIIYKFDLEAFPDNVLGPIWMVAGLCTTVIVYALEPEEVINKLKGTKAAETLKKGKLPDDFLLLLSICLPLIPEDIQSKIMRKMNKMGLTLPNFSLEGIVKG